MGLRDMAGDMARNTSGLWQGIADALDPTGRGATAVADEPMIDLDADHRHAPVTRPTDSFGEQDGRMVVPLDTWTRILEQVGNVHEAGQQLADARERAARAETENRFLKEQLADLKAQRRPTRRTSPKPVEPEAHTTTPSPPPSPQSEGRFLRGRRLAARWLSP